MPISCSIIQRKRKTFRAARPSGLFSFAMFPIVVTRSIEVIGKNVSVVFTARFEGGTEKMLRDVRKDNGTTKPCDVGVDNVAVLSRDDSPLYRLDWTTVPLFGSFKKDYPKYPKG